MSKCLSFLHSLIDLMSSTLLKPWCKSRQLCKMAGWQTQHLWNYSAILTSMLVTKSAVNKQGLASTCCWKETHVSWHEHMSCTIWGQQCAWDVTKTTHVCGREKLFFLFWWINYWKIQPPTLGELLLGTIFSSVSHIRHRGGIPATSDVPLLSRYLRGTIRVISHETLRCQGKD